MEKQMEMVGICLTEIKIEDLNGTDYKLVDISTQIGNLIFVSARTIEVNDISRKLHKGETAHVSAMELEEIMEIVAAKPLYAPFVQLQILNYLNTKLKTFKTLENEN